MRAQTRLYNDAWCSGQLGCRKEEDPAAVTRRLSRPVDGLVGILFSTIRRAYGPVSLPGDGTSDVGAFDVCCSAFQVRGGENTEREGVSVDPATEQRCSGELGLLTPGCGRGFGAGLLDLCLAEQSNVLLRELYKVKSICRTSLSLQSIPFSRVL